MATANSRDVELNLRVQTLGTEGITALEQSVRKLAEQGGQAAPAFNQLADEIAKLGENAAAFNGMQRLAAEVTDLEAASERARATTVGYAEDLLALNRVTVAAADAEQKARDALAAKQVELQAARDQLSLNRTEVERAKLSEEQYAAAQSTLRDTIRNLTIEVRANKDELAAARAATEQAATSEAAMEKSLSASTATADANSKALRERSDELRLARAELEGSVLATNDLAAASALLSEALQQAARESKALQAAQAQAAEEAEIEATRERARVTEQYRTMQALREQAAVEAASILSDSAAFQAQLDAEDVARKRAALANDIEIANEQHRIMAQRRADAAAEAEGILNDYRQMEEASAQRLAALKAEAAEEDRLAKIVQESRARMAAAAKAEAEGITRDFEQMAASEKAAATAGANALTEAFSTIGTRPLVAIEEEIANVKAAMVTLAESGTVTGGQLSRAMQLGQDRIAALELETRKVTNSMSLAEQATQKFGDTFGHISKTMLQVGALMGAVDFGHAFIEANVELQKLRLGFDTLYHSAGATASQIDFLQSVANHAGVSFGDLGGEFLKFSASMQQANVPMQQSNELFAAITQAAGTLGLAGADVGRMLNALGQMAAKGTVSMEELRQQLGDSLPGALGLTAKGLGITEQQLIKLVTAGGLMTSDMIPALTGALKTMGGEVNTLGSSWERFKNALTIAAQGAGDGGWIEALSFLMKGLGLAVALVILPLQTFFELVFGITRAVAAFAAPAATWTEKFQRIGEVAEQSGARLNKTANAFDALINGGEGAAKSTTSAGNAMQTAGQKAQGAAGSVAQHTSAVQANATASNQAATASAAHASATQQAGAAAAGATQNMAQLGIAYADAAQQLEKNVESAKKLVKAADLQAKSIAEVAKMTGSEVEQLNAAVEAANAKLEANRKLAEAQQAQADKLRVFIDALKEEIRVNGDANGARAQVLETRQRELQMIEANIERTKEAIGVDKAQVAQSDLNRRAHEDNSKAVDGLRKAYEAAQHAVEVMKVLQGAGMATQEQVNDSVRTASEVLGLYKDALNDVAAAADRAAQAAANKNLVTQAGLRLQDAENKGLAALAKSMGDTTLARYTEIKAKEIEIERSNANATAMDAEAAKMRAQAEALKTAAQATGDYNAEKQAEYDRLQAAAQAKDIDAKATRASTEAIGYEIQQLRQGTDARDANTTSINDNTDALDKNSAAKKKNVALTHDGFEANPDGSAKGTFNNSMPVDQAWKLAYGTGGPTSPNKVDMTLAEAQAAMTQAENALKDMQATSRLAPGAVSFDNEQSTTALYTAARTAYERIVAEQSGTLGGRATSTQIGGAPAAPGTAAAAAAAADPTAAFSKQIATEVASAGARMTQNSTTHTVTITLNGKTVSGDYSTADDAQKVVDMLRQLETASRSAT